METNAHRHRLGVRVRSAIGKGETFLVPGSGGERTSAIGYGGQNALRGRKAEDPGGSNQGESEGRRQGGSICIVSLTDLGLRGEI